MKARKFNPVLIALALLALTFGACGKYEYDERDRFVGRYEVEEYYYYLNTYSYFDSSIEKSDDYEDEVIITNFFDTGYDVYGVVEGSKIYIDPQTIGMYTFEGYGSLSDNTITINYEVAIARPSSTIYEDVVAVYLKY